MTISVVRVFSLIFLTLAVQLEAAYNGMSVTCDVNLHRSVTPIFKKLYIMSKNTILPCKDEETDI